MGAGALGRPDCDAEFHAVIAAYRAVYAYYTPTLPEADPAPLARYLAQRAAGPGPAGAAAG